MAKQSVISKLVAADDMVGAIILAAGRSTRMGEANKLLADLGGRPIIARTVDILAAAGLPPPVIVVGHMADAVRMAVGARPATFVATANYAEGISYSIAAGIAAVPEDWRAVLIALGDMPGIAPATLASIAAVSAADAVVVPVCQGQRGNPVAWGRDFWPRLFMLGGDRGARDLLAAICVTEVETNDQGIFADIDTPEALAVFRRQLHSSSSD